MAPIGLRLRAMVEHSLNTGKRRTSKMTVERSQEMFFSTIRETAYRCALVLAQQDSVSVTPEQMLLHINDCIAGMQQGIHRLYERFHRRFRGMPRMDGDGEGHVHETAAQETVGLWIAGVAFRAALENQKHPRPTIRK